MTYYRKVETSQNRYMSYADVRRRDLRFDINDLVYLKIPHMNGIMMYENKGKLSLHYVGPHKIFRYIGKVSFELHLRDDLTSKYPIFRAFLFRKCVDDPNINCTVRDYWYK